MKALARGELIWEVVESVGVLCKEGAGKEAVIEHVRYYFFLISDLLKSQH